MRKMKSEGEPGVGKAHIMLLLTKPKWMPLWLHRWREKHAWLRWRKDQPVTFPMPPLNPYDIFMPDSTDIAKPRPWPKKEQADDAETQQGDR